MTDKHFLIILQQSSSSAYRWSMESNQIFGVLHYKNGWHTWCLGYSTESKGSSAQCKGSAL